MFQSIMSRLPALLLLLPLLPGCSDSSNPPGFVPSIRDNYQETGGLDAIARHGKLRILVNRSESTSLPRQGSPLYIEQELAARFARSLDLDPVLVHVDSFDALIDALQQGRGDLIAANLTITENRKQQIAFTVPIGQARQQLVTRPDSNIDSLEDLAGRTIAVQAGTTYQASLQRLQKKYAVKAQLLSGNLSPDDILDRLADERIDVTILDSNLLDQAAQYRQDFRIALALSREQPLAWGIRKDSPELLEALNRFLNQQQLAGKRASVYKADFAEIRKKKTLRVLTRNNAASYFLWRGELLGFEYELARRFADQHDLRLEMIVADAHDELIPMLEQGKGDMIAAFMTVTESRKQQDITFSRPYHYAPEVLVVRADEDSIDTLQDLAGRRVHVRRSSAYWNTLQKIRDQGIEVEIVEAPETMETEQIIGHVAEGKFDLTVADGHLLDIELTWRDDIRAGLELSDKRKHAWVVRKQNTQLLQAINRFIRKEYRGLFYNITYEKYFENSHNIKSHRDERIDLNPDGTISPYDRLVKKYARQYGFDWRMLVAQIYQESRFDPQARSWVGAEGLMQVMPRTAREMKFDNLEDPETGIHAGVKYLDWVRDRFETELDVRERMWFTLAAYNAGQGHVKDARRLARRMGWNPNRWFGDVEKAMLLLSKRKYHSKSRHGYVRGREPVNYVRDIRDRYRAYVRLAEQVSETL